MSLIIPIALGMTRASVITHRHETFKKLTILPNKLVDDHAITTYREGINSAKFSEKYKQFYYDSMRKNEITPSSETTSSLIQENSSEFKTKFQKYFDFPIELGQNQKVNSLIDSSRFRQVFIEQLLTPKFYLFLILTSNSS